jgi:hypothetical protein
VGRDAERATFRRPIRGRKERAGRLAGQGPKKNTHAPSLVIRRQEGAVHARLLGRREGPSWLVLSCPVVAQSPPHLEP